MTNRFVASLLLAITSLSISATSAAWDPYRDLTGKTLKEDVSRRFETIERSAEKFVHNPVDWVAQRPGRLLAGACTAVPNAYEDYLSARVDVWYSLPTLLINAVQSQYAVDLRGIRYAQNISTVGGKAQTFGNAIYFPQRINLQNRNDLHWMLHELEHSVQYANSRWGSNGKLCEYLLHAVGNGFVHDDIGMERAAARKANYLIDHAYSVMTGTFPSVPVSNPSTAPGPQGWPVRTGLLRNELWVRNETSLRVTFFLQTRTYGQEMTLGPFAEQTFRGHPADSAFYIAVPWQGQAVQYMLNGGTRQHIAFGRNNALDVFYE